MSNRKKPQPPQPQPLPDVPAPYCDTYRYNVDEHGVLMIWGGLGPRWQTGMAMPFNLAVDLHQKLGNTIADIVRRQSAAAPATPAAPEEPAPKEIKPQ